MPIYADLAENQEENHPSQMIYIHTAAVGQGFEIH
jgi:hypothetical protein